MKIKRFIDKAYEFVLSDIPENIRKDLKDGVVDEYDENIIMNVKNDICLEVNKTWVMADDGKPYVEEYELSYGNVYGSDYCPIDSVVLIDYKVCKDEIEKEINYLLGCAFPNTKIER